MNKRIVLSIIGKILQTEAILLVLPALVSLFYDETKSFWAFLITATFTFAVTPTE